MCGGLKMTSRFYTVTDFKLGALYRFAAKRGLDQPLLAALLVERVGMSGKAASQLAAHWFTTEPFRSRLAATHTVA